MKNFKCFVRGENIPGFVIGLPGPAAFYTTCYIRANSDAEIESMVQQKILNDAGLSLILSRSDLSDIRIVVEEIEIVSEDGFDQKTQGFVWYDMNAED